MRRRVSSEVARNSKSGGVGYRQKWREIQNRVASGMGNGAKFKMRGWQRHRQDTLIFSGCSNVYVFIAQNIRGRWQRIKCV